MAICTIFSTGLTKLEWSIALDFDVVNIRVGFCHTNLSGGEFKRKLLLQSWQGWGIHGVLRQK
jgi:hypothetical protein